MFYCIFYFTCDRSLMKLPHVARLQANRRSSHFFLMRPVTSSERAVLLKNHSRLTEGMYHTILAITTSNRDGQREATDKMFAWILIIYHYQRFIIEPLKQNTAQSK